MLLHHWPLPVLVVGVVAFCCFFAWVRTAILAGGVAVVRSGVLCFAEDGEWLFSFCSLATGLLGQTAHGAKKCITGRCPAKLPVTSVYSEYRGM